MLSVSKIVAKAMLDLLRHHFYSMQVINAPPR